MSTAAPARVPTRRPAVVTFIGVVLYIQGFLAAVAAASMLMWRNDILDWLEQEGAPLGDSSFTGTIIGEHGGIVWESATRVDDNSGRLGSLTQSHGQPG